MVTAPVLMPPYASQESSLHCVRRGRKFSDQLGGSLALEAGDVMEQMALDLGKYLSQSRDIVYEV